MDGILNNSYTITNWNKYDLLCMFIIKDNTRYLNDTCVYVYTPKYMYCEEDEKTKLSLTSVHVGNQCDQLTQNTYFLLF